MNSQSDKLSKALKKFERSIAKADRVSWPNERSFCYARIVDPFNWWQDEYAAAALDGEMKSALARLFIGLENLVEAANTVSEDRLTH